MTSWMVGIDTGGTFTDLIAFEVRSGELRVAKVSSDPSDPSNAVMAALDELFVTGVAPGEIVSLVHGTTVGTNAVLEGKGVKTGLLITDGFRAVYEARGWSRPDAIDLIDPFYQKPPLLAPQALTHGIPGRFDYQGNELVPLDEDAVRRAAKALRREGVESVAVCFLFSFQNTEHETRTGAILAEECVNWRVSLSSEVLPTIREYPRQSTTVIDAYVGPTMQLYLERLSNRLQKRGIETPQVFLMQSNGGLMRITIGARFPNQTLLSGPAGGVVAGEELSHITGYANITTLDMGGTSTDIAMISEGRADETNEGKIAGQDIGTPMLQVRTLGAGGGTIAWIGPDGLLKVGPESAGSSPGPACYGRGGDLPTVTDANLVLGALAADNILGGRMALDKPASEAAIQKHLAGPLGLDILEAAAGILRIVNTNMAVDLRLAFQSRGEDPRKYMLAAFGGAGPLHAVFLARDLNIPTVAVPLYPGLNSAMGLLQTSVRHVYVRSSVGRLAEFGADRMNRLFAGLKARAEQDVCEEGFTPKQVILHRQVDMRYQHQGYQLPIDCPYETISDADKLRLKKAFDEAHHRVYGASAPDEDAEVVTLRVIAEITVPRLKLPEIERNGNLDNAKIGTRPLYHLEPAGFMDATIYDRSKLTAGNSLSGPAVVQQFDSTTVILAGMSCTVDDWGNLIINTGSVE
ncbi:MAG: hydantoinase/oxoprolinase family protein [Pseudomonadota bacterium]|nr:hydantoinase/oxoprolinase family protein [Pseudomonadota bacterium]